MGDPQATEIFWFRIAMGASKWACSFWHGIHNALLDAYHHHVNWDPQGGGGLAVVLSGGYTRNTFIAWELIHHTLPTKQRLSTFQPQIDNLYALYSVKKEEEAHLLSTCTYATTTWNELRKWWRYTLAVQNNSQLLRNLKHRSRDTEANNKCHYNSHISQHMECQKLYDHQTAVDTSISNSLSHQRPMKEHTSALEHISQEI
ncbi:LOW QUALITY PROTEIN: hypothetical protein Cgig2_022624 [Carnegiea gigantea]|uniref:Reverse transcriptase zinc-binding domain-containing protein n=1 Tax=Carnegiea gigantea TaxID=171969 RepID=A0A9Q1JXN6_9CARY|nr:LOW QUALITY PROTEIN: hypothetical protein Cgig2_022624 [Carnegiea gigantea]